MNEKENMALYEQFRTCPQEAKRAIGGGKLSGKTDINPMWRIKKLTETFGPCGIGWKAPITEHWIDAGSKGEAIVNIRINLYVKYNGEWSEPIEGIGGNTIIQTEKGQLVSNDEAYKMAYTDAISVACKSLGVAADVYFEQDRTKYARHEESDGGKAKKANAETTSSPMKRESFEKQSNGDGQDGRDYYARIKALIEGTDYTPENVAEFIAENYDDSVTIHNLSERQFKQIYASYYREIKGIPWNGRTYI